MEGLSALSMQVGMLTERLRAMDERLTDLERRKEGPGLAGLLREVATPREWAAAFLVALLALWGIVTPDDVRDKARALLDLPPLEQRGPG